MCVRYVWPSTVSRQFRTHAHAINHRADAHAPPHQYMYGFTRAIDLYSSLMYAQTTTRKICVTREREQVFLCVDLCVHGTQARVGRVASAPKPARDARAVVLVLGLCLVGILRMACAS